MSDTPEQNDVARATELAAQLLAEDPEAADFLPEPGSEQSPEPAATAPDAPDDNPPAPEVEEPEEEFVPRADLESLLEGVDDPAAREKIITAYKSFQRGFTQRSQEISELRRAFDGVDPAQAREAYEFMTKLSSDGEFARQVHGQLTKALTDAGWSLGEAQSMAADAVAEVQTPSTDWDELGIDPEHPLVKEVSELREWQRQQEQRAQERDFDEYQQSVIREIERQDADIRRQHTSYDDDDMDSIYKIAASTSGDLWAAQEMYEGMRDRWATDYVARKQEIPEGVSPVTGGAAHTEEPVEFRTIKEGHKYAVELAQKLFDQES